MRPVTDDRRSTIDIDKVTARWMQEFGIEGTIKISTRHLTSLYASDRKPWITAQRFDVQRLAFGSSRSLLLVFSVRIGFVLSPHADFARLPVNMGM